jgi:plasmid maintenance system antidote protein VapI
MAKPSQEITHDEILKIIKEMVSKWGTQKELADHLGISNAYLNDIIHEKQAVSDKVARRLGYKRIIKYVQEPRKEKENDTSI